MGFKTKSFIHNGDKLVGADGSADGILPEDVQDWLDANGGTVDGTSNLNITCCPYGANQVFTLIVIDDNA